MQCAICGNASFRRTSYRSNARTCPALACMSCTAITLDERAARDEAERASVRMAIAARKNLSWVGDHEAARWT